MTFHAIIPAGGAGSRLWPLSRANHPKFLVDFGSGHTMIHDTVTRLAPLASSIYTVTGTAHAAAVRDQLAGITMPLHYVVEPSPRGTMAAIGIAAALAHRADPDALVGSFAADHRISDTAAFTAAVRKALEAASRGYLVTLGITPTGPATGFGYIRAGAALPGQSPAGGSPASRESTENAGGPLESSAALQVEQFVEKPDAETAARYLAQGGYYWNAGIFVARAATLMDMLTEYRPDIAAPLRQLAQLWDLDSVRQNPQVEEIWASIPKEVIDRAVAEPAAAAGRVAVVPADMGWSDVGDYDSLAEGIPAGELTTQRVPGSTGAPVLAVDAPDSLVYSSTKPVVVVGVPGAVVIDTGSALLVTTRDKAQDVKKAVDGLDAAGLAELR
ncbi:mannose-1-phosphate guanylyltransferase [Actinotignum schaalii]|uniref:Mannose-1-phosphate guanylyltransferase/mannose-6-phosphate isomerase n=1 Tax=Actinotignum schaalii FB123-CNA-2 TaxID=883067 RepID=S2VH99_9ACTO|nr:sugar phosphate nucleotidyltransferase [Actinotignum schaalii]EPD26111.1 mannose-1-phosphate guanylyltransferase/mannose-6-phosphate isomerase [Actinotignum schaalii FB123-CNA-2]